jgi:hypothetical protein
MVRGKTPRGTINEGGVNSRTSLQTIDQGGGSKRKSLLVTASPHTMAPSYLSLNLEAAIAVLEVRVVVGVISIGPASEL